MDRSAFSIVELLLTIAIFSVVLGISLPVGANLFRDTLVNTETYALEDAARTARTFAITKRGDETWGVHLSGNTITTYQGGSYATRNATEDQITTFDTIAFATTTDITFTSRTGRPSASQSVDVLHEGQILGSFSVSELGVFSFTP